MWFVIMSLVFVWTFVQTTPWHSSWKTLCKSLFLPSIQFSNLLKGGTSVPSSFKKLTPKDLCLDGHHSTDDDLVAWRCTKQLPKTLLSYWKILDENGVSSLKIYFLSTNKAK